MRIGYFGGSFDPPHRGHLAVARAARDRFSLHRVLLAPTGRQPFKPNGPEASFADRLRMTELLCENEPGLEASAIDAPEPNGRPNYTVDTLRRLRLSLEAPRIDEAGHRRPQSVAETFSLFAIAGVDAFLGVPQWHEAHQLFALADWIVVSRPSFSLSSLAALPLTPAERTRVHTLADIASPVSATKLRRQLMGKDVSPDALLPAVLAYIDRHGLYGRAV